MALTTLDPTDPLFLSVVEVRWSGVQIGNGVYLSANHTASPTDTTDYDVNTPDDSFTDQTTQYDITLPNDSTQWHLFRDDNDGDGFGEGSTSANYDMGLHIGNVEYSGDSASMLIAMDPTDLQGTVSIVGHSGGNWYESTGILGDSTLLETNDGITGAAHIYEGAEAIGGMSGGGNFLLADPDQDGNFNEYLIGVSNRAGEADLDGDGVMETYVVIGASISPFYDEIVAQAALDGRDADDFERVSILAGQTLGSTATTVNGTFLHEDIFGGVNNDSLSGNDGDDNIFGRSGDDVLSGGDGTNQLTGGAGADRFVIDTGTGNTQITDFSGTEDFLDLSSQFDEYQQVLSAAVENPDGSLTIALPNGGSVNIDDLTLNELSHNNVSPICFAKGCWIDTDNGALAVEDLRIGDLIKTLDHGYQPIKFIFEQEFISYGATRPVRITPGALGNHQTVMVSQHHRVFIPEIYVNSKFKQGALIKIFELVDGLRIRIDTDIKSIRYFHIMFERHELIYSSGLISESWQPLRRNLYRNDLLSQALKHAMPQIEQNTPQNNGRVIRPQISLSRKTRPTSNQNH